MFSVDDKNATMSSLAREDVPAMRTTKSDKKNVVNVENFRLTISPTFKNAQLNNGSDATASFATYHTEQEKGSRSHEQE